MTNEEHRLRAEKKEREKGASVINSVSTGTWTPVEPGQPAGGSGAGLLLRGGYPPPTSCCLCLPGPTEGMWQVSCWWSSATARPSFPFLLEPLLFQILF